jgi:hypothetical protein
VQYTWKNGWAALFERFMAGLLEESARKLRPLEKFCQAVGSVTS